jgi:CheY-like chemotaxis protein
MSSLLSRNRNTSASAREIQLLRETVATMMLRIQLRKRSGPEYATEHRAFRPVSLPSGGPDSPQETGAGQSSTCEPGGHRTRILLISDYEGLRYSRELLLRKQGYQVQSMTSGEFLARPASCPCDLAILCQSLESDRALLISAILRRTLPASALLRVYPFRTGLEPEFELGVDGFDGPAVLLDVLRTYVHTHSHPA